MGLLQAFVDQEALMLYSRATSIRLLHAWRHERGLLAGARDAALASWPQTVEGLCGQGFSVLVRPFGGSAVPIDHGVLNVTLIMPEEPPLDAAFRELAEWLVAALVDYGRVDIGEVAAGYCPGRYDLALGGKKISGIAQRRLRGVVAVSAFVNLYPVEYSRTALVKSMYAAESAQTPAIDLSVVSDLVTLTNDERFYDPYYFLSRMTSVRHVTPTSFAVWQLIAQYRAEAQRRLTVQRRTREWLPHTRSR